MIQEVKARNYVITRINNIDNIHDRLNEDAAKKLKFKFYKIVEFCNLESCSQLISTDLTAGVFMPVKFAVYQADNKEKVIISFLKPTAFASIFNSDGMKRIAEILEKQMKNQEHLGKPRKTTRKTCKQQRNTYKKTRNT